MDMGIAITLLAFSAPITAAIIQYVRPSNGGVSRGEFRLFDSFVRATLASIERDVRELRKRIDDRY